MSAPVGCKVGTGSNRRGFQAIFIEVEESLCKQDMEVQHNAGAVILTRDDEGLLRRVL